MKLLSAHTHKVYKPVEMLARLYVLDSLTYPDEAKYWLSYAQKLAREMIEDPSLPRNRDTMASKKAETHLKRVTALECAWLIDLD